MSASIEVKRWCYRCADCLQVAFADEEMQTLERADRGELPPWTRAICVACGGPIELMGQVAEDHTHLEEVVERCACDYRCTLAMGPHCECRCGGVNHGTGNTVLVIRELGPIPRLLILPTDEAKAIAKEWREEFKKVENEIQAFLEKRNAEGSRWLPESEFRVLRRLQHHFGEACKNRTHEARMRNLRKARGIES